MDPSHESVKTGNWVVMTDETCEIVKVAKQLIIKMYRR